MEVSNTILTTSSSRLRASTPSMVRRLTWNSSLCTILRRVSRVPTRLWSCRSCIRRTPSTRPSTLRRFTTRSRAWARANTASASSPLPPWQGPSSIKHPPNSAASHTHTTPRTSAKPLHASTAAALVTAWSRSGCPRAPVQISARFSATLAHEPRRPATKMCSGWYSTTRFLSRQNTWLPCSLPSEILRAQHSHLMDECWRNLRAIFGRNCCICGALSHQTPRPLTELQSSLGSRVVEIVHNHQEDSGKV
mmetsp:Transcript_24439/g.39360  ORF Transcript_24439/g.39360 Transcript_24439/m.39360 type:complete len:250 (-) Transcript_24439:119-868(-)